MHAPWNLSDAPGVGKRGRSKGFGGCRAFIGESVGVLGAIEGDLGSDQRLAETSGPGTTWDGQFRASSSGIDGHWPDAEPLQQASVAVAGGVGGGEELFPQENRIRPGQEAEGLELVAHRLASGGEPDH